MSALYGAFSVSSMTSPGMKGLSYLRWSPMTTCGGLPLLYQYSSTFRSDTGAPDMFLTLRMVTMSVPTFLADTSMNWTSAVPFSGLMNFAGAAGGVAAGVAVGGAAALVAGACAGLA